MDEDEKEKSLKRTSKQEEKYRIFYNYLNKT